jgi:hypothetical protein
MQPGTIVRPDTHLVTEKLSLLFGEDKEANDELTEAWKDHRRKLKGGLNPVAYGRVPFIPLYAAAGDLIQFGRLTSDGQVGCQSQAVRPLLSTYASRTFHFCTGLNKNLMEHQGTAQSFCFVLPILSR